MTDPDHLQRESEAVVVTTAGLDQSLILIIKTKNLANSAQPPDHDLNRL